MSCDCEGPFNGDDAHDDPIIDCENHPQGCAGTIVNSVPLGKVISIQNAPKLRRRREVRAWVWLVGILVVFVVAAYFVEREV